jgi:hypothetical protein
LNDDQKRNPQPSLMHLAFVVRIHSQRFHQQTIAEPLVAENFMGIIGEHGAKVLN